MVPFSYKLMHHLKPFAIVGLNGEITVQCWFPKWFWMVGQLIQNLVWIFLNGSTANTKPCLDTSKWWINGPSKTIGMDLNCSTACYQHCSNGITMCVQNQWVFLKVKILNGFKWSISRRVNCYKLSVKFCYCIVTSASETNSLIPPPLLISVLIDTYICSWRPDTTQTLSTCIA